LTLPPVSDGFLRFQKWVEHLQADCCSTFHLPVSPNAHAQNPLKFFRRIKPAGAIAESVSREIVSKFMLSASGMGEHMVGCKSLLCIYRSPAQMASRIGLGEHGGSLFACQGTAMSRPWEIFARDP
jgi:hypothetical protein